jgi:hypothetical protein
MRLHGKNYDQVKNVIKTNKQVSGAPRFNKNTPRSRVKRTEISSVPN